MSEPKPIEFKKHVSIDTVFDGDMERSGTIFRTLGGLKWTPPTYRSFTIEELKEVIKAMEESKI